MNTNKIFNTHCHRRRGQGNHKNFLKFIEQSIIQPNYTSMKTIKSATYCLLLSLLSFLFYTCGGGDDDMGKNSMDIISIDPNSPATLKFNEFVVITFEYNIVVEDGA